MIEKGNFLWSGGGNEHEEKNKRSSFTATACLYVILSTFFFSWFYCCCSAVNMFLFRFCVGFMHLYSLGIFFGIKKVNLPSYRALDMHFARPPHTICLVFGLGACESSRFPQSCRRKKKRKKETKAEYKLLQSCVPRRCVAALLLQVHLC